VATCRNRFLSVMKKLYATLILVSQPLNCFAKLLSSFTYEQIKFIRKVVELKKTLKLHYYVLYEG
jgi:hypothetical protein